MVKDMVRKHISEENMYRELIENALQAIKNSYSPYSNFRVGSAVLCSDGKIYRGTNIENASYGLSICAERVAIFNAISNGCKSIDAIAVISEPEDPVPPCGACLQVIQEFASSRDMIVILRSINGNEKTYRLKDLLPVAFTKEELEHR